MLPDRVSNPGPLTYESGALPIALCGPAIEFVLKLDHLNINPMPYAKYQNPSSRCSQDIV